MGNCLGCGKKLSYWEGFATKGEDFCKTCFPKRKEIFNRLNTERELKEKKQKETEKKQEEIYIKEKEKEKEIKKILRKISTKKQKKLILEKVNHLEDKEKSKLIEDFDEFNESETVIWVFRIITIVLWVYLGKNVIFGSILFFIFFPLSWFFLHSKKNKLINKIKILSKR